MHAAKCDLPFKPEMSGKKDSSAKISSQEFYSEYYGHRIEHLQFVHDSIRELKSAEDAGIMYLVGDSTLDNKHWFTDRAPAVNGYEQLLEPPSSVQDVAYWLNVEAVKRGLDDRLTALNCAVEESTIGARSGSKLLDADCFVRDHLQPNDIVVLSLGGNDIALKPSLCTILNVLLLLRCNSKSSVASGRGNPLTSTSCMAGCLSNLYAWPLGYGYFLHLFSTRVQAIAVKLISGAHRPKKILICMLYYLDTLPGNSWADPALKGLGYDRDPAKLQGAIRSLFKEATSRISVPGTEVVAVPLFAALDGTRTADYAQRVEPSAAGGARMATLILDAAQGGSDAVRRALQRAADGGSGDGAPAAHAADTRLPAPAGIA